MRGVFCKKVENVFLSKAENGGVFCKKVDLSSTQGALYRLTVSVFFILHFTYLGCAYAPNAPPPAYGPGILVRRWHNNQNDLQCMRS